MSPKTVNRKIESDRITQAIFEHAARISRESKIEELARLNADFARDLIGADRCSLWLVDKEKNQLWTKVAHGVDTLYIQIDQGLVGACVRDNQVLIVNDAGSDDRLLRNLSSAGGYQVQQVLCVPMVCEGNVIGALQLLNKSEGFTEADSQVLGLLAHFAASAIESERLRRVTEAAHLMQHELILAQEVQSSLLPRGLPPRVAGLECAGYCRPAQSIGGDYYDLLPLPHGRFALTVGDVSGKGIPAAVMMASIQTLLRSLLRRGDADLGLVFNDLNRTLCECSTPERYSTLFCAIVSADRSGIHYVNAGHVWPYLVRSDGAVERLEESELPVAFLPALDYRQLWFPLKAGETLVVVSDGLTEAMNPAGDLWQDTGIERALAEYGRAPLEELPELLTGAADRFANGAEQHDDMTVAALRIP
ncbi:MAG: GAF domain-containing SpoIIE family protein phosphatase [Terracidiphilus sp.]